MTSAATRPFVFAAKWSLVQALLMTLAVAFSTKPAKAQAKSAEGSASHCANRGTVERWDAGGGVTFLPKSGNRLYAMRFLGEDFAAHRELSHSAMQIDGIFYQFLSAPTSDFALSEGRQGADVLAQRAAWEFQAAQGAGGKLDRFQDLGNKVRPAGNGLEAATFNLWRMQNAGDSAAKFFVTTVVRGEVVVMSAILRPVPGTPEQFCTVYRPHAETLKWWGCPG